MTEEPIVAVAVAEVPAVQPLEPPLEPPIEKPIEAPLFVAHREAEEAEKKVEDLAPQNPLERVEVKITEYVGLTGYTDADDTIKKALKYAATSANPVEFFQKINEFNQLQPISVTSLDTDAFADGKIKELIVKDLRDKYPYLNDEQIEEEAEYAQNDFDNLTSKIKKIEYLRGVVDRENERRGDKVKGVDADIYGVISTKVQETSQIPDLTQEVFDAFVEPISIVPIKYDFNDKPLLSISKEATTTMEENANWLYQKELEKNLVFQNGAYVLPETFDKDIQKKGAMEAAMGIFFAQNDGANVKAMIALAVKTALENESIAVLKQSGIGKTVMQKATPQNGGLLLKPVEQFKK